MADRDRERHMQVSHPYEGGQGIKSILPERGPSSTQVLALLTGIPVGGTLLALAGLALAGSVIGLMIATPLFIIFSPVIVPAAITIGLAVTGFLSSGLFGLTGLSSISWVMNYLRGTRRSMPEQMEYAKRRMADVVGYTGQKTKDVGQTVQSKAQETSRT
ncbi:PREDICTED: oleosin 21.2 kDa-like [Tarenaya hassleriana]|uniref:oleosin 21.2 kDa-like n=1 Tax=Tarenaya hassleriana TaxID=28532 RepID=UPI00053C805F|nr:PREDICTED: oleosin 21.2 kDa-like [Tarenaya hassleriana]